MQNVEEDVKTLLREEDQNIAINKDIWKIFSNIDPVTGEDLEF